jgi:hypothetical protein
MTKLSILIPAFNEANTIIQVPKKIEQTELSCDITTIVQRLEFKENRFGIEINIIEIISRLHGVRIYEVGIAYYGRTYAEGKKINWKDGLWAMYCILEYNLL